MVDVVFWLSLAAVVALTVFLGRFSYRDWLRRRDRREKLAIADAARRLQDEINARAEERAKATQELQEKQQAERAETQKTLERLARSNVVQLGTPVSTFGNRKQRRAKAAVDRKKR